MDRDGAGTRALSRPPKRRDPLASACSLLLAGIAGLCLVEVALRYGFGGGVGFYDELAGFALVWLTFLGAVLARRDDAHIGIRDLVRRLGPRPRRFARLAEHLVMLGLHLLIAWFGAVLMLRFLTERAITMSAPMGLFYFVLPLFAGMTVVLEARRLLAALRDPES